ncbi:GTP-binding protein [Notoacmeibacter sp. MSK16QG-6]|uniref:CobW family GTP-binding protein n=1 Tax=Notoacmeibacter sp. MSK16QG-6 TaxID=2957982 RepID=UPI00209EEFBF|nr:GTP-binding protein [Notoacmeibacter sp. MSK16QG-6]MCP1200016.1 GTP-binding protein [Notoacmeibacter sp. MSK16QG-6]
MNERSGGLPVILLTGFLGAGKTTFLNRLLLDPALGETGVIVNEFGDVPVDGTLIETATGGTVLEMAGGCLCCAGGGALDQTLLELIDAASVRGRSLTRILIETSGMADPMPILMEIGASDRALLSGVITVVDLQHGEATLAEFDEARRQVAVADLLLLSKTELASSGHRSRLHATLRHLSPYAEVRQTDDDASQLLGRLSQAALQSGGRSSFSCEDDGHAHQHEKAAHSHRHSANYATTVLRTDRPLAPIALNGFLEVLVGTLGSRLLRVKGLVRLAGDERPLVVQAVQSMVHPPRFLDHWPDESSPETAIVVITQGDRAGEVEAIFGAFTGQVAMDRPDAAALSDNPLAVPGFSSF